LKFHYNNIIMGKFNNFVADVHGLATPESTEKGAISNAQVMNNSVFNTEQDCQFLIDGEWGANYDPETKTMLGGYCLDGCTFKTEFVITEIDKEKIPYAIDICSDLYSSYGTIFATYKALVYEYENRY